MQILDPTLHLAQWSVVAGWACRFEGHGFESPRGRCWKRDAVNVVRGARVGQGWFDAGVRVWKGKLERERVPNRMQEVIREQFRNISESGGEQIRQQLEKQSRQQKRKQAPDNYLAELGPHVLPQRHTQFVVPFYEIPPPELEPGSLG